MELGEGTPATGEDLPIDLGLPGLPLELQGRHARQGARGLDARAGLRTLPRQRLLPARQPRARVGYAGHGTVRRSAGAPRRPRHRPLRRAGIEDPRDHRVHPPRGDGQRARREPERSEPARPGRARRPGRLPRPARAVQRRAGLPLLHRQDLGRPAAVRAPLAVPHQRLDRRRRGHRHQGRDRARHVARSTRPCPASPPTSSCRGTSAPTAPTPCPTPPSRSRTSGSTPASCSRRPSTTCSAPWATCSSPPRRSATSCSRRSR